MQLKQLRPLVKVTVENPLVRGGKNKCLEGNQSPRTVMVGNFQIFQMQKNATIRTSIKKLLIF